MTLDGAGTHVMHATGTTNKQRQQGSQSSQKMKNIFAARLEGRVSTLRTRGTMCLYLNGTLRIGDGEQSPDDFARQQSASTGLPEHMCKANMAKNHFVLNNMEKILDALTRGLPLGILSRGYGEEDGPAQREAESREVEKSEPGRQR